MPWLVGCSTVDGPRRPWRLQNRPSKLFVTSDLPAFLRVQSTAERQQNDQNVIWVIWVISSPASNAYPELQAMCVYMIIEVMAELKQQLGLHEKSLIRHDKTACFCYVPLWASWGTSQPSSLESPPSSDLENLDVNLARGWWKMPWAGSTLSWTSPTRPVPKCPEWWNSTCREMLWGHRGSGSSTGDCWPSRRQAVERVWSSVDSVCSVNGPRFGSTRCTIGFLDAWSFGFQEAPLWSGAGPHESQGLGDRLQ